MDRPPMTPRHVTSLFFACLFMLVGAFSVWDGHGTSAIACAVLALVAAILGRIP